MSGALHGKAGLLQTMQSLKCWPHDHIGYACNDVYVCWTSGLDFRSIGSQCSIMIHIYRRSILTVSWWRLQSFLS